MARTARELIRELASRLGELVLSTATADGLATTLTDSRMLAYIPADTGQLNAWVYCYSGTNAGQEARAKSWAASSATATLYPPGFASPTATGDAFEFHMRTRRSRKLEALNEAIGMLNLSCYRPVVYEGIVTESQTYRYILPSYANWGTVTGVEMQSDANDDSFNHPPVALSDWSTSEAVDVAGNRTVAVQFGAALPPGRVLRIHGTAFFTDLASDFDTLALSGRYERVALSWIYDWAAAKLFEWEGFEMPAGQSTRYDAKAVSKLLEARDALLRNMMPIDSGKVTVPGRGTATSRGGHDFIDILRIEP